MVRGREMNKKEREKNQHLLSAYPVTDANSLNPPTRKAGAITLHGEGTKSCLP